MLILPLQYHSQPLVRMSALSWVAEEVAFLLEVSTFSCDITPRIGSPLCGGMIAPAAAIEDPQSALGMVLRGDQEPVVLVTLDCLGVYNRAYDRFVAALADAAGTRPQRVLLTSVHQHDAPWYDPKVQSLIDHHVGDFRLCDTDHLDWIVAETAAALRNGLEKATRVTRVGLGRSKVDGVASNRRILGADGRVQHMRMSSCENADVRAAPLGLIDPYLTALRLFDNEKPVATVYHYATHPMTYYGQGRVSSDFCGLARARRQAVSGDEMHLFVNGCAGNVAAGKYNDGSDSMRVELTNRVYNAMTAAVEQVRPQPLAQVHARHVSLRLPVRDEPGLAEADCIDALRRCHGGKGDPRHSALMMSWRGGAASSIDVPVVDFGVATMVLLPGEPFIEFQLEAQQWGSQVTAIVIGYGNGGPGYLCTDAAYDQGGYESGVPAYTGRGAEAIVRDTLRQALA